ncbi:MAG: ribosome biogenesis GTP-binding protein YihA/YsxC [Bacteroidetes bacterium]|nr:ribosome biogenesis GTP-binding protein YihA/YsxC [Bacteroidota bacterium]
MQIRSATFVMSNSKVSNCPTVRIPEYAFIGRSNVGKSSLINSLTQRKSLAKTSGRPGKTQLINHFLINNQWHLVDLPGYGYARVSKKDKKQFQSYIQDYFKGREQLVCSFVLVDIRHKPQPIDLEFMIWLTENERPFYIIFTKADKLKPGAIERHVSEYLKEMTDTSWEYAPPHLITSSSNNIGREEVLEVVDSLNQDFNANFSAK